MTILDDFKGSRLKSFTKVDLINTDIDLSGINWSFQSLIDSRELYLGRFSEKDIRNIIRSIGLLDYLESLGFSDIHFDINRDENYINYLKIYWQDKVPEKMLLDLRVSEHTFIPHERFLRMALI